MQSFKAPLIVTDGSGTTGTIIGPQVIVIGGNPAGIIQANALLLYGGAGVDVGPQRLSLIAEPGIIDVTGDDNSRIRLAAGGQITVNDSTENNRFTVDASGTVTITDSTGVFTIVLRDGSINIVNSAPGFSSSILLEAAGRITLSDALGNTAQYEASGWTVNGNAGCAITNGGSLNVSGDIFNGGNLSVSGDIFLPGADCAEHFDVAGEAALEPGTVLIIDDMGGLRESGRAYDRRVAGVVSGAGELRPGIILDRRESAEGRAPVALVGKVYCKAEASTAPIEVGDLLTTSSAPGHAMRAADRDRAFGAVLGKALKPLPEGHGLIPILVALQ